MKKILIAVSVVLFFSQCETKDDGKLDTTLINNPSSDGEIDTTKGGLIVFVEDRYDFGDVEEGATVEHTFKFRNAGDGPLLVQDAKPACGCTISDFTKEKVE